MVLGIFGAAHNYSTCHGFCSSRHGFCGQWTIHEWLDHRFRGHSGGSRQRGLVQVRLQTHVGRGSLDHDLWIAKCRHQIWLLATHRAGGASCLTLIPLDWSSWDWFNKQAWLIWDSGVLFSVGRSMSYNDTIVKNVQTGTSPAARLCRERHEILSIIIETSNSTWEHLFKLVYHL